MVGLVFSLLQLNFPLLLSSIDPVAKGAPRECPLEVVGRIVCNVLRSPPYLPLSLKGLRQSCDGVALPDEFVPEAGISSSNDASPADHSIEKKTAHYGLACCTH